MFNLAFISHFYAVVIASYKRLNLKMQYFQTQDAMRSLLQHAMRSLGLKFYVKLHYLLDSWMFTTLPAPN